MKVGDLVRIKGLARPENADIGIVIAFKARVLEIEATVLWNSSTKPCRYWSSHLEVIA